MKRFSMVLAWALAVAIPSACRVAADETPGQLGTAFHAPVPMRDITIRYKAAGAPRSARLLRSNQTIKTTVASDGALLLNIPELTERCVQPIKQVLFDRDQSPQLRVLALNLLTRRHLTIADVMRLKNRRFDEAPGMRVLMTDFLHEYF